MSIACPICNDSHLTKRFLSSLIAESFRDREDEERPTISMTEKRLMRAKVRGEGFEESSPLAYFKTVFASSRLLRRADRKCERVVAKMNLSDGSAGERREIVLEAASRMRRTGGVEVGGREDERSRSW